jgi:hypothetical protein
MIFKHRWSPERLD